MNPITNLERRFADLSAPAKMFIWIAACGVVLDQISKYLVIKYLTRSFELVGGGDVGFLAGLWRFLGARHPARGTVVEISRDFWHLRYVENPGAAWGFLSGAGQWFRVPFFLMVSVCAMIFIIAYFRKTTAGQKLLRIALAMVFSGAIGNFLDRVRLGYVIDFVDWHWYDRFTWPTFNVADAFISVGVAMLVLDMLLNPQSRATSAAKSRGGGKSVAVSKADRSPESEAAP